MNIFFTLKKILSVLWRPGYKSLVNPRQIKAWEAISSPNAKGILRVIREVGSGDLSPEESAWVDRIESLRDTLSQSEQELELVDYGAGSSSDARTEEAMHQGVRETDTVGAICRNNSKKGLWPRLLFKLVRQMKPKSCLEMGTSLGLSCAYQAAALELNGAGRIITLEGADSVADKAGQNLKELGLNGAEVRTGRFMDTLDDALKDLQPLDYAFIDGHHDEHATIKYFEMICPYLAPNAILVFDDIFWTAGMQRAWHAIRKDERVEFSLDLFRLGLCVVNRDAETSHHFKIAME